VSIVEDKTLMPLVGTLVACLSRSENLLFGPEYKE
jgi:hypothetical protein